MATSARSVSQKTIVEVMRALREYGTKNSVNFTELLYEHGFADWFVGHARNFYRWDWTRILIDMRNGQFFFNPYTYSSYMTVSPVATSQKMALSDWVKA